MKCLKAIWILLLLFACEDVVNVGLPNPQLLIVIEGWVSDTVGNQRIRVSRSSGFSNPGQTPFIENAEVSVLSENGEVFSYSYASNGYYHADIPYQGENNVSYRLRVVIDGIEIRSRWDQLPANVAIDRLQVESFEENDPNNSNQSITIYYPKINTRDPEGINNYYRWIFLQNGVQLKEPEPITIQNDRVFDGNLIPNNFQNFEFESGDNMTVQLISISSDTYNYLNLLKTQITTLGTSSATPPTGVDGNLFYVNGESNQVLGYFGAISISEESAVIP